MSHEALRTALAADFQAKFKSGMPLAAPFPVRFPNQPFQQPRAATWGHYSLQLGRTEFSALGQDEERTLGIVYLQVFCAEEKGTKPGYDARDLVRSFWSGKTLAAGAGGLVQFWSVSAKEVGKTEEGLFQVNVETEFRFDFKA